MNLVTRTTALGALVGTLGVVADLGLQLGWGYKPCDVLFGSVIFLGAVALNYVGGKLFDFLDAFRRD